MPFYGRFWCSFYGLCGLCSLVNTPKILFHFGKISAKSNKISNGSSEISTKLGKISPTKLTFFHCYHVKSSSFSRYLTSTNLTATRWKPDLFDSIILSSQWRVKICLNSIRLGLVRVNPKPELTQPNPRTPIIIMSYLNEN